MTDAKVTTFICVNIEGDERTYLEKGKGDWKEKMSTEGFESRGAGR